MQVKVKLEDAQSTLLSLTMPLPEESVELNQANGRVLHTDLLASHSLPEHTQSAVDGFAVHEVDLVRIGQGLASFGLEFYQSLKAGEEPTQPLAPGRVMRVVTGGRVPDLTAGVIAEEQVRVQGERVFIDRPVPPGSNLKATGEDFTAGEVIARSGRRLDPGLIGIMAAMGQGRAKVYRRPRVAVVSFGSEIVQAQEHPGPGQVRDCNGPLLAASVARDGGQISGVEILSDQDRKTDKLRLEKLLAQSDLLLTIGGAAHEPGDQALAVLRELGARMLFWGVQIKPGSHSGAGCYDGRIIVSLSGNPAPCWVGYELLAVPVLRALQGLRPLPLPRLSAVCTGSFPKGGGPRRFLRGYAVCGQDGWRVAILPGQKSSMLRSLLDCNALIDLPAGHQPLEAGGEVSLILLGPRC